jgi:hypothetical protein
MLLKTNEGISKTKLKRTPIECLMRAINPKFEPFDTLRALAVNWNGGMRPGRDCPTGGNPAVREKIQKQWERSEGVLETKEITFLNAAHDARFVRQSAQIRA